jgi:branched-subunit amino acid ABC-type transport system permease component
MSEKNQLIYRWVIVGIVCGILADLCYGLAIGLPMPDRLTNIVFFAFGPLLMAGAPGTYFFIKQYRNSITLQVGTLFMIAAGMSVTVMAVVQRAVFSTFFPIKPEATNVAAYEAWKMGLESGNAIQLGLDIVWDIFILTGTVLLAISMFRHPRLGKVISIVGITIGLLGLYFNLSTFPTPPGAAGSFDIGPFVGLWFLAVTIMMIASLKWMRHSLDNLPENQESI